MNILTNQTLEIENLLSIRFKDKQENVNTHINELIEYAKSKGANRVGMPISTTYEINPHTGDMDMEIYFGVDKSVPSLDRITFKEKLCLYNCLKIKHKGNPNKLQETYDILNNYIADNRLIPISTGFNIVVKDVQRIEDIDEYEMDIYISISPNIF